MSVFITSQLCSFVIAHFGVDTRKRGARYHAEGRVHELRRLDGPSYVAFESTVHGRAARPYATKVTFHGARFTADCTCPVGTMCKHAVATLHAVSASLPSSGTSTGPTPSPSATPVRRRERARAPAPNPLPRPQEMWVEAVAALARRSASSVAAGAPAQPLIFVLDVSETVAPRPVVRLERATLGANGSVEASVVTPPERVFNAASGDTTSDRALVAALEPFTMGYASLVGAEGARNLARLVATGRAYARFADALVKLSEAPERRGTLVFETEATGFQRPRLEVAGAASMVPTSPPWYIDREACAAGPVRVDGVSDDFASVWLIGQPVPPEVALAVAKRFESMEVPATIPRPTVRRTRHVRATPRLVLRLESATAATAAGMPDVDSWARGAWTRVFFDYDGVRVDPSGPDADTRVVGDEVVVVDRSRDEEGHLLFALQDAGLVDAHRAYPEAASLPGTLRALPSVSPYLLESRLSRLSTERVTVEKASDYAFDALEVDDVDLELDEDPDAVDRLGVSVGIRVGGETFAALPLLLAALGEQAPGPAESLVVPLPDGRVVLVPARKLLPLRELLLELAEASSGPVVSRARALALDPAFIKRGPESLRKVREALAAPRAAAIPRALKATLRDYQKEGFRWLMARRVAHLGAVLADDMGLGKTVQTLALLLAERRAGKPSLVVCPKSVLGNWEAEAAKFAPSLRVHVHHGEGRESRLEGFDTADVVLTTYAILLRDAALFEARRFSTVVLDEAQTVKTAASAVTHAACAIPAEFRLALSGTPMENHLGELWSVMRFALPELLGDAKAFTRAFRRPIEREGSEPARRALIARLAPFVLRRRKEQVASELPAKTVVVETIELEEAQRNVYETVRAAMDTRVREALAERGMARSHIIVLDALLKLRQAVCDPRLLPAKTAKKAPSAKLEALIEKLTELVAEGRRVLVFSQFVTMLDLIQKALDRAKLPFLVLTGATEGRTALVREFQSGRVPIFLLSLKAGGTGLNLTAADVVIHYDPWWNPAAEMQATDRAHRIGQDKAVLVYKLVGRDTIEEKILRMQDKKQALFASVLDGQARAAKTLTADDVAFLFSR